MKIIRLEAFGVDLVIEDELPCPVCGVVVMLATQADESKTKWSLHGDPICDFFKKITDNCEQVPKGASKISDVTLN